ncbi:Ctr-domain-containing protein [Meredithblackwellia eburnea MCA 4105]
MDMNMNMTSSTSSNMTSSSSDMSSMGDCKISMLWNWYTVDTCFISTQWHNRTLAAYAGSVVGIFFVAFTLELLRRFTRDYDRAIKKAYYARQEKSACAPFRPTNGQQGFRALCYGVMFGLSYLLMLVGMYYNGGMLIAIVTGAATGYFFAGRDTASEYETPGSRGECCQA